MAQYFKLPLLRALTSSLLWLVVGYGTAANSTTPSCQSTLQQSALQRALSGLNDAQKAQFARILQELAELRLSLDKKKVLSRGELEHAALEALFSEKERQLLRYHDALGKGELLELRSLLSVAIHQLQERSRSLPANQEEREQRRRQLREFETLRIDGKIAHFHVIEPGFFMMGEPGREIRVEVSSRFEFMATPVTQVVWQEVALLAQEFLSWNPPLNPEPARYTGALRPVESVSYRTISNWLSALNELGQKYPELLAKIFFGHRPGDLYRLPSEKEWEFVARRRGLLRVEEWPLEQDVLAESAWLRENAGRETQKVGLKIPLFVEKMPFYDLFGNVWELTSDFTVSQVGGLVFGVMKGGSIVNDRADMSPWLRNFQTHDFRSSTGGFRLVRVAK